MSKKECRAELKWILVMAIIVIAFLLIRGAFLRHEEEQVEMALEAGYQSAIEDVINDTTVVSTYEVDGDCYIVLELPNGELHEFVSPKALG